MKQATQQHRARDRPVGIHDVEEGVRRAGHTDHPAVAGHSHPAAEVHSPHRGEEEEAHDDDAEEVLRHVPAALPTVALLHIHTHINTYLHIYLQVYKRRYVCKKQYVYKRRYVCKKQYVYKRVYHV